MKSNELLAHNHSSVIFNNVERILNISKPQLMFTMTIMKRGLTRQQRYFRVFRDGSCASNATFWSWKDKQQLLHGWGTCGGVEVGREEAKKSFLEKIESRTRPWLTFVIFKIVRGTSSPVVAFYLQQHYSHKMFYFTIVVAFRAGLEEPVFVNNVRVSPRSVSWTKGFVMIMVNSVLLVLY